MQTYSLRGRNAVNKRMSGANAPQKGEFRDGLPAFAPCANALCRLFESVISEAHSAPMFRVVLRITRESLQQVIAPKERRYARTFQSLAALLLTHELFTSWPKPQSPLRRHRGGLRNSDPNPKSSHSARRRRTRRARHRPDGNRQDRVLRAADADAARTRTR